MASRITDEEILDWWEWYDAGKTIKEIAEWTGRPIQTIRNKLKELDVYEPNRDVGRVKGDPTNTGPRQKKKAPTDQQIQDAFSDIPKEVDWDNLTDSDLRIMQALKRIAIAPGDIAPERRGGLPFAHVLQHNAGQFESGVKVRKHVMSARQRIQDKMNAGATRDYVRRQMKAAGLLPPSNGAWGGIRRWT